MATYVIYADAADGYAECTNATYATARSGAGTLTSNNSAATVSIGQYHDSIYYVDEAFLSFDTSVVAGVPLSAVLSLYLNNDGSTSADFTINARAYDWGSALTTADFVAGASLSGNALRASIATSALAAGYNDFTSEATFKDNLTNPVRLVLASDRTEAGTSNAGNPYSDYVSFKSTDESGTSSDPKLTVVASDSTAASDTASATDAVATVVAQIGPGYSAPTLLSDSFTDSAGTVLTTHDARWTRLGGTSPSYVSKISGAGRLYQDIAGAAAYETEYGHSLTFENGYIEFLAVAVGTGANGGRQYWHLRRQADSGHAYQAYRAYIDGGHDGAAGSVAIEKYKGGVLTTLDTYTVSGWPGGSSSYLIRFSVDATNRLMLQAWNGSSWDTWCDVTDSSSPITGAGYPFLALASRGSTGTSEGLHVDDLVFHDTEARTEAATVSESAVAGVYVDPVAGSDTATVADTSAVMSLVTPPPESASTLSGWSYRKLVSILSNDAAQTDYPVQVNVPYVAAMQADYDDLRFTADDGTTLLTFWRASVSALGGYATFYVVIPSLPASGGVVQIYMHYGNAGASYGGETLGANGIFTYDGGTTAVPNSPGTDVIEAGTSTAWDDSYIASDGAFVKNLDGSLYVDGDGYGWAVYNGANQARRATIDLTSPYDGNDAPGDDRPGFFKFLASDPDNTVEKVSTSAPFLTWGSGTWDPSSGTTWDGRVVQQGHIFYDADGDVVNAGEFICFYDGDAGPANVSEAYREGVAIGVGANPGAATWTKKASGNPSGQAWTFQHSQLNIGSADDLIAYAGGFVYDPLESDPDKRWKQWYTGHTASKWGIMYATAPDYDGPWTRHQSTYVWQPRPSDGGWNGWVDWAMKVRGVYYIGFVVLGADTDTDGRKKWAFYVGRSTDGINWTLDGDYFNRSHDSGDWDYGRVQGPDVAYNPVTGQWMQHYTASDIGNGAYGDTPAYVPPLKIAVASWEATPLFLDTEPTVTLGGAGERFTVSDSVSVTVGVGATAKSASDSFTATDTSSGLTVVLTTATQAVTVTDTASNALVDTATASDVVSVSEVLTQVFEVEGSSITLHPQGMVPGTSISAYLRWEWLGPVAAKLNAGPGAAVKTTTVADDLTVTFGGLDAGEYVAYSSDYPTRRLFFMVTE